VVERANRPRRPRSLLLSRRSRPRRKRNEIVCYNGRERVVVSGTTPSSRFPERVVER